MIVTFLPHNLKQSAEPGQSLLAIAGKAKIHIDGDCGGKGKCGQCKVKVVSGNIPAMDDEERAALTNKEIDDGYRLACRLIIEDDLCVEVPAINHAVSRKLKDIILPQDFKYEKYISKHYNKKTVVVRDNEIIGIEPGDTASACYGIAFDIGTTTVAGMLWDFNNGELIGVSAMANPQSIFGADVISRINYCSEGDNNTAVMQDKIVGCLNQMIEGFDLDYGIKPDHIYQACVVGNTTMSHLFLGVNPAQLARAPFKPVFCDAVDLSASEIKLNINQAAKIHLMPNIAGHVGSDIVGGLLATGITKEEGLRLFIDVGTNGEIVLSQNGRILTCSAAAGPAFEGAAIYRGMRASAGAIESVKIEHNKVVTKTVGDQEPIGICGSGLIDAVSLLLKSGVIDWTGKMLDHQTALDNNLPEDIASRLRRGINGNEFVLAWGANAGDVVLTQKDIRQVQLAKGAIYAGVAILLNKIDAKAEDITQITIAGAFGNYINKESALRIGLFPKVDVNRIVLVGNAAGVGASMALLSLEERRSAQIEAKKIEHIELAADAGFQTEYIDAMNFPK